MNLSRHVAQRGCSAQWFGGFCKQVAARFLLLGRVTYEMMEVGWRPLARTGERPDWMEPWMEHFARTIDAAKKYVVASSVLLALLSAGHVHAQTASLADGYYSNPILAGDYPDPSVFRDGDDYYMTHSSFEYYPGLLIWHSTDLVNLDPHGPRAAYKRRLCMGSRVPETQGYLLYLFSGERCELGDHRTKPERAVERTHQAGR